MLDVKIPEVGESISEGVLTTWFKVEGDHVDRDEPLFELETDKITMEVAAEAAGQISVKVAAGETVAVGQVVATIDPQATQGAESAPTSEPVAVEAAERISKAEAAGSGHDAPLSPAVRRVVEEHRLDPAAIEGTGKGGRITKADALGAVQDSTRSPQQADRAKAAQKPVLSSALATPPGPEPGVRETRKAMTSMRRRIAERLVEAQQTAAILTTFNEADMSAVIALRSGHKAAFQERHSVKLGFMSFFVKAVVDALKTVPALNGRIEGEEIVQNHYYDIGVAVGTPRGLVVPVLRESDRRSFAQIESGIGDLASRAAKGRLELSELQGGCFTISNGGVYGSMLSTPILNPPQSGILGLHSIKKRAVVVGPDDRIEVRPMMYLALSYDHRIVDGSQAVTFLKRVVECIEAPERLLLET